MAAPFPPWANTATHLILGDLIVVLAGALAVPIVCARTPYARARTRGAIATDDPRFTAAVAYEGT